MDTVYLDTAMLDTVFGQEKKLILDILQWDILKMHTIHARRTFAHIKIAHRKVEYNASNT